MIAHAKTVYLRSQTTCANAPPMTPMEAIERQQSEGEFIRRGFIEFADLPTRRLDVLTPVVQLPRSFKTSLRMNFEQLPRGSFGNHQPYPVQIRWYAITKGCAIPGW